MKIPCFLSPRDTTKDQRIILSNQNFIAIDFIASSVLHDNSTQEVESLSMLIVGSTKIQKDIIHRVVGVFEFSSRFPAEPCQENP